MVRQLEISGAKAVVAHPSLLETVRSAAARVPTVAEVACTGGDVPPEGVLSFEELLRTGREETPSRGRGPAEGPADVAVLQRHHRSAEGRDPH